jgi:catechol 2,3-dioxygenase-like lactoylglutathione lyase family enzyme
METRKTLHVSLNVADLPAAIASYRKILGIEPAKVRPDYAKFELTDPPVILSLNPSDRPGTVGHLGIRHPGTGDVATELVRVRNAAMEILEQPGVTCCYATADKFWVRDADGMPWEMYALTADADVHSAPAPQPSSTDTPVSGCCAR